MHINKEYSDHSIELYKDDGTYIGRLEFNDGYCPHIVDFTTFNGQPFWLISEFVKDVNDCLGLVPINKSKRLYCGRYQISYSI